MVKYALLHHIYPRGVGCAGSSTGPAAVMGEAPDTTAGSERPGRYSDLLRTQVRLVCARRPGVADSEVMPRSVAETSTALVLGQTQ